MRRTGAWLLTGALVVLTARTIVYALAPSPLAVELGRQAGGPGLPAIALVALALGIGGSAAVVWLAALGVEERRRLERRPLLAAPRLRLGLLAVRAACLFLATCLAFALVESTIHWREGLGWHGLHCLVGPVHRNAIPVLAALSLLAAALFAAVEHVERWLRRTLARLAAAAAAPVWAPVPPPRDAPPLRSLRPSPLGARGPPS